MGFLIWLIILLIVVLAAIKGLGEINKEMQKPKESKKYVDGYTDEAKYIREYAWHKWFAGHPTVIGTVGENENERKVIVSNQWVWRRKIRYCFAGMDFGSGWEYSEEKPTKGCVLDETRTT